MELPGKKGRSTRMMQSSIARKARSMSERDEGVEAAWEEEIERRVQEIDSGEVKTISWEEVRAKAYSRLNDVRKRTKNSPRGITGDPASPRGMD